ncbi:hypothetical protein CPB83DRAFT_835808 [Crepidotus variabilis]|uniref:Uncharacterized protein n=1 Tax=Crepidotus variabilis TaxID=179855 RepID=A0A9P6EGN8_9AGAR|nr:hypothetical protein CPB83DRAFT_835808 [Crepidotus variabilis]
MSRAEYDQIIAHDCNGPNKDKKKAERFRTFTIPQHLVASQPSTNEKRTINISYSMGAGGLNGGRADNWRAVVLEKPNAKTSAVDAIAGNGSGAFVGFGCHLASDFLHTIAFFPVSLKWWSDEYRKRCCGNPNPTNPLEFNLTAHRNYLAPYDLVFRRCKVKVEPSLYNELQSEGLLDPDHTVGTHILLIWSIL